MADKVDEKIENEVCTKKKDIVDSPVKEKQASKDKPEAENGDVCETKNGKTEEKDQDKEETTELVCPVKRKSVGTVDATDADATDDVTPEKKAKLDDAPEEAESNGEAEVAA